jgi:hypothetical protein
LIKEYYRALRNKLLQIPEKLALKKFLDSAPGGSSRELLVSEARICKFMSLLGLFFSYLSFPRKER